MRTIVVGTDERPRVTRGKVLPSPVRQRIISEHPDFALSSIRASDLRSSRYDLLNIMQVLYLVIRNCQPAIITTWEIYRFVIIL